MEPTVQGTSPVPRAPASTARWLRRTARLLIVLGACAAAAAFILRLDPGARAAAFLTAAAVLELGGLLALRARGLLSRPVTVAPARAYVLAALIAAAYIGVTAVGNPAVRAHLDPVQPLKLLAVGAALVAGPFEETLFRKVLMDRLQRAGRGPAVQVLVSGLVFGAVHFYAFAGLQGALIAQASTTVLGWALAGLYLASKRNPVPCMVAHSLTDAVLEPALLLSMLH